MDSLQNVNSTVTAYIWAHCIRKTKLKGFQGLFYNDSMTFKALKIWKKFKYFQGLARALNSHTLTITQTMGHMPC